MAAQGHHVNATLVAGEEGEGALFTSKQLNANGSSSDLQQAWKHVKWELSSHHFKDGALHWQQSLVCAVSMAPLQKKRVCVKKISKKKKVLLCFWESPTNTTWTPRNTWATPEFGRLSASSWSHFNCRRKKFKQEYDRSLAGKRRAWFPGGKVIKDFLELGFYIQHRPLQHQNTWNWSPHLKCWQVGVSSPPFTMGNSSFLLLTGWMLWPWCVCVWLHVYRDDSISTRVESSAVRNRSTRALLSFVCALIQVQQPWQPSSREAWAAITSSPLKICFFFPSAFINFCQTHIFFSI